MSACGLTPPQTAITSHVPRGSPTQYAVLVITIEELVLPCPRIPSPMYYVPGTSDSHTDVDNLMNGTMSFVSQSASRTTRYTEHSVNVGHC